MEKGGIFGGIFRVLGQISCIIAVGSCIVSCGFGFLGERWHLFGVCKGFEIICMIEVGSCILRKIGFLGEIYGFNTGKK